MEDFSTALTHSCSLFPQAGFISILPCPKQQFSKFGGLGDMRKLVLAFILIVVSLISGAQEPGIGVSFTPAMVQSPEMRYGYQPGVEFLFTDRLSLLTEIAFSIRKRRDESTDKNFYLRIKPELRYLLFESRRGRLLYAGIQASYAFRKWNEKDSGSYIDPKPDPDLTIQFTKASINSPILTGSLQFGYIIPIYKKLSLDIFIGFGGRTIFTKYDNIENPTVDLSNRFWDRIFPVYKPAYRTNGTVTRLHFNGGYRLLYRF
jgi:hypothetical protein